MTTTLLIAILACIGTVASPFATLVIAKRRSSGTVGTSDAAELWAESNALRKEYRERAEQLEGQLKEVQVKLATVTNELSKLRSRSVNMAKKIDELKGIIAKLRRENDLLLKKTSASQQHNGRLREALGENA